VTLYDDAVPPKVAEELERRRFDRGQHLRQQERLEDDAHRAAEGMAEELAGLRDQRDYVASGGFLRELDDRIVRLEDQLAGVVSWLPLPDPRLSPSMGADERAEFRGGAA
jgi:hypothetical protein